MPKLNERKRLAAACSAALFLTACGGGGGGSAPQDPATKITQHTATVSVGENSSSTFNVNGSIKSVSVDRPAEPISVDASGSALAIDVGSLINEQTARYNIRHSVNGAPHETILTIEGVNTSAAATVAQANAMTTTPVSQLAFYDTQRLSNILLEIQYLAGQINESQKVATQASIQDSIDQAAQDTKALKDALTATLAAYRAGQVGEQSLAQKVASMNGGIEGVSDIGKIVLDTFSTTLNELNVAFPADLTLKYDEQIERYTRFKDSRLGAYDANGSWIFTPEYDWLNAALTLSQGQ